MERLAATAFVLRCAGAAVLALLFATWAGLDHPVWATVSALVVSQDRLGDTRRTLVWRLVATAAGIGIAVTIGSLLAGAGPGVTLGVVVAICAALARWRSNLRLSMWTAAIVLLTVAPGQSIAHAGVARGVEVSIGCLIGAALHQLAEVAVAGFQRRWGSTG
ncbi:FUSC family protein [Sphingomonas sp. Leaf67]|uniref:FUSC family protein n=1 Tax=Sphingomonas sp. Leaf67 TaxID=1736230 RepID=UPI00190FDFF6|nr:FUSC family protein [Sphingomonas sp. Leaf67]